MTKFESALIDLGYKKYTINPKTHQYEQVCNNEHNISAMGNLLHVYFLFRKRNIKLPPMVSFGLSESGKGCTLLYPRPKIEITRLNPQDTSKIMQDEQHDDSMNIVLQNVEPFKILMAAIDKTHCFKFSV